MSDLRTRFAAFDRTAAPDLWPEVERRARELSAAPVPVPVRVWGPPAGRSSQPRWRRPLVGLLVAAILVGALAAALAVGGWLDRRAAVTPRPSDAIPSGPIATTAVSTVAPSLVPADGVTPASAPLTCDQSLLDRSASGWRAGPRPQGEPRNGAIAAWTMRNGHPDVVLLDPASGVECLLGIGLPDDVGIGQLLWSPDGNALAIVPEPAVGEGSRTRLFVVSPAGLYKVEIETPACCLIGRAAWSPDGAHIAVVMSSGNAAPSAMSVWIVAADGSPPLHIPFDCDPCYTDRQTLGFGRPTFWSPHGTQIAIPFEDHAGNPRAGGPSERRVLIARTDGGWAVMDNTGALIIGGWWDDTHLLATDGTDVLALATDGSGSSVLDGVRFPNEEESPDGRRRFEVATQEQNGGVQVLVDAQLIVRELGSGRATEVATGRTLYGAPVTWSPDSQQLVFMRLHPGTQRMLPGVWIVDADGSDHRRLSSETFEPVAAWQPIWP